MTPALITRQDPNATQRFHRYINYSWLVYNAQNSLNKSNWSYLKTIMTKKIFCTNLLSLFFFFHFTAEFAVAGHIVYDKVFVYSAIYGGPEVSIFCPHVVAANKNTLEGNFINCDRKWKFLVFQKQRCIQIPCFRLYGHAADIKLHQFDDFI